MADDSLTDGTASTQDASTNGTTLNDSAATYSTTEPAVTGDLVAGEYETTKEPEELQASQAEMTVHSPNLRSVYRRGRPPGPDTLPTVLASPETLPLWYQPLVNSLRSIGPEELAGFGVPVGEQARSSAVLVLFGADDATNPDVLLTRRHSTMRSHAGQVSFPGGSVDKIDRSPIETAMREAHEETLVDPTHVEPVALLPELWIPPSGFAVTTVLGWWKQPSQVTIGSPDEVEAAARVKVADLVDPNNRVWVSHPIGFTGPGFVVDDMFVWGFTAIVLDKLLTLGGWDTEWQTNAETLPYDFKLTSEAD